MIELSVYSVLYSLLSRHRIVLLKETDGDHFLPIWIGTHEAEAIAMRLQDTAAPRPLTHDLLRNMVTELGGTIAYVVVNDLASNTFYAKIAVQIDGETKLVDSRPSDAIALAVRASVPIRVEEAVLEKAGITPGAEIRSRVVGEDDQLDVFREFVDSLDLDDMEE